jgi:hemerythrin
MTSCTVLNRVRAGWKRAEPWRNQRHLAHTTLHLTYTLCTGNAKATTIAGAVTKQRNGEKVVTHTNRNQAMKPSSWTSELETGLSELDSDHKQLLAKANRLKQASTDADFSDLKSALLDMKTEMVAHFSREEALMRDCRYEAAQEHWDEHQRLLAEIKEKIDALETFENSVSTFGNFIHQWMFQHIAGKDTLFGRAVISQVGTTDRRREDDENFDAFEERRMNNLEAIRWPADVATGVEVHRRALPGDATTSPPPTFRSALRSAGRRPDEAFRRLQRLGRNRLVIESRASRPAVTRTNHNKASRRRIEHPFESQYFLQPLTESLK